MEGRQTSEVATGDHLAAPVVAVPERASPTMGNHAFAAAAQGGAGRDVAVPPRPPPPPGDAAIERGLARAVRQRAVARDSARLRDMPGQAHVDIVSEVDEVRRQAADRLEQQMEYLEDTRAVLAVQVQTPVATAAAALADPDVDALAIAGQVAGATQLAYIWGANERAQGLSLAVNLEEAGAALRAAGRPREETMAAARTGLTDAMAQLETAIEAGSIVVPGPPGEDAKPQLAPQAVSALQSAHAQLAAVHGALGGYVVESEFLDAAADVKQHAGGIASASAGTPGALAAALTGAFRTAIAASGDVAALGRDRGANLAVARNKLAACLALVPALLQTMGAEAAELRRQVELVRPPRVRRLEKPALD